MTTAGGVTHGRSKHWVLDKQKLRKECEAAGIYTPDGCWIVYCRAETGLVSQPGSRPVMVPAGGGAARERRCNRPELNSWHSFAPNGRWMVFSSKPAGSPLTRVCLPHIDSAGQDAPALLLHRLGTPGMAAILPEAVACGPQSPQRAVLREPYPAKTRWPCKAKARMRGRAFQQAGDRRPPFGSEHPPPRAQPFATASAAIFAGAGSVPASRRCGPCRSGPPAATT